MAEENWVISNDAPPAERARANKIRLTNVLIAIIRLVCGIAAALLVTHIVLTLGGANPDNGITRFVADAADTLALGFGDLFTPADAAVRVTVNYGLAALFWLAVGAVITRVLRRATSPYLIS